MPGYRQLRHYSGPFPTAIIPHAPFPAFVPVHVGRSCVLATRCPNLVLQGGVMYAASLPSLLPGVVPGTHKGTPVRPGLVSSDGSPIRYHMPLAGDTATRNPAATNGSPTYYGDVIKTDWTGPTPPRRSAAQGAPHFSLAIPRAIPLAIPPAISHRHRSLSRTCLPPFADQKMSSCPPLGV